MKFLLLIHSKPQPWGHPTWDFVAETQALPAEQRDQMERDFQALLTELEDNGELVLAEALGDPANATLYRWQDVPTPSDRPTNTDRLVQTDGPYSETKEHLAGYFLIDVADRQRAEEIARGFAGPGETIELRPTMWPGGEES